MSHNTPFLQYCLFYKFPSSILTDHYVDLITNWTLSYDARQYSWGILLWNLSKACLLHSTTGLTCTILPSHHTALAPATQQRTLPIFSFEDSTYIDTDPSPFEICTLGFKVCERCCTTTCMAVLLQSGMTFWFLSSQTTILSGVILFISSWSLFPLIHFGIHLLDKVNKPQTHLLTRIHGTWYDLATIKHPGGPLSLRDRDGTALFKSHHSLSTLDIHKMLSEEVHSS